ncbi:MAG: hypothetical protein NT009_08655 [Proteobacteria bacterium]|nr:hypothetical protein [Pseudomonadota bacterium]
MINIFFALLLLQASPHAGKGPILYQAYLDLKTEYQSGPTSPACPYGKVWPLPKGFPNLCWGELEENVLKNIRNNINNQFFFESPIENYLSTDTLNRYKYFNQQRKSAFYISFYKNRLVEIYWKEGSEIVPNERYAHNQFFKFINLIRKDINTKRYCLVIKEDKYFYSCSIVKKNLFIKFTLFSFENDAGISIFAQPLQN